MNIDHKQVPTCVSGGSMTHNASNLRWLKLVALCACLVRILDQCHSHRALPPICLTFFVLNSHSKFNDHSSDNGPVENVTRSKMERVLGACILCVQFNLQRHWFLHIIKIDKLSMLIFYVCYRYCAVCHDETTSRAGWSLVRKL